MSDKEVRELAYQVAGAVASIFMQLNPKQIMPTEEITNIVEPMVTGFIRRDQNRPKTMEAPSHG